MKLFLLAAVLSAASLLEAGRDDAGALDLNVNTRYTVESVELAPQPFRLSSPVATELERLIGERLNPEALNRLSRRITEELRARSVTIRVLRGQQAAHVRVRLEIEKRDSDFDVSLSNLAFNSAQGWTGTGQAKATFGSNSFTVAGLSNGDDLVERYSGVRVRVDRLLPGNRVRAGFEFDNYREQYAPNTISSLGAGAYRSRMNFEPSATFSLFRPLTLTVGLSFERMQPGFSAARVESANAVVNTLRYHEHWKDSDANSQDLEAAYGLRAATQALGSDHVYSKHTANVRYAYQRGRQLVEVAVMAGIIYGRAPLFERFVLGNNTTLRGWDKYELDPLGGNRAMHASVTYGYHIMRVFYDTGAIWDRGKRPEEKHSVGIGIHTGLGMLGKNSILMAVAFPVRQGRAAPTFLAGMNF